MQSTTSVAKSWQTISKSKGSNVS